MTDLHSIDRDVERAIRSWLHEDRHEDASRLAGAVLDQLDTTRRRRAMWWPAHTRPAVTRIIRFGLAAAIVVAVLAISSQWFGRPAPGGVGAQPTTTPKPRVLPSGGALDPGTYRIADRSFAPVDLVVTVPAGWVTNGFRTLAKDPGEPTEVGLGPDVVTHVYGDACDAQSTVAEIGPKADDLVAALLVQQNLDVTDRTEATIGGYPGQRLDLAHPPGLDLATCSQPGVIQIWSNQPVPAVFWLAAGHAASVYVADVDGQRVVVATDTGPEASQRDIAERDAIVASLGIGP
jgi:hypothetical protein